MSKKSYTREADAIHARYGFILTSDRKHRKYKHERLGIISTCSSSPSDVNALRQIERQCRRLVAAS
jgi:hypothetical protein